jgi:hypothetical protein
VIRLAASILVRALVELALVLFLFAGVFLVVAFRTARRFATPTPDALDKLAGPLAGVLGLIGSRSRSAVVTPSAERDEPELYDPGVEQADELIDWRELVV